MRTCRESISLKLEGIEDIELDENGKNASMYKYLGRRGRAARLRCIFCSDSTRPYGLIIKGDYLYNSFYFCVCDMVTVFNVDIIS